MPFDIATIAVPVGQKDAVLTDLGLCEGDDDPACAAPISGGAWRRSYILWLNDVADPFDLVPPRYQPLVLAVNPGREQAVIGAADWRATVTGKGEKLAVQGDAPKALFQTGQEVRQQASEIGLDDEYEIPCRFFHDCTGFSYDSPVPAEFRRLNARPRRRRFFPWLA